MKYTIILKESGQKFTWDEWLAKKPQERTALIVLNKGAKAELQRDSIN